MIEDEIDRRFRALARGILTEKEAVDFSFAELAYESRFDLVSSLVERLLKERLDEELRSWLGYVEADFVGPFRYMPFQDSRLVIYHFGDYHDSTPAQQDAFRDELRSRLKRLAELVRLQLETPGLDGQKSF